MMQNHVKKNSEKERSEMFWVDPAQINGPVPDWSLQCPKIMGNPNWET
jgi:hypothetical protein